MRMITLAALWLLAQAAGTPSADHRQAADAAFEALLSRDFTALAENFSPEMTAAAAGLSGTVGPTLNALGPLLGDRPEPQVVSREGNDVFMYPAEFQRTGMTVIITVNAAGEIAGLFLTPPQPAPVQPGELVVKTGEIELPATLTLPEGEGPFPAIVLVHGSGPNDRDETVGANAPFRDLAEGLAAHGVATLRYVKRTRQVPLGGVRTVRDEVIDDALSALALARSQPGVDPERVYLLGHSLGAYLAPRIARDDPAIAGVIMLAGNVRPIWEVAAEQLEYLNAPPERLEQLGAGVPASYREDLETYDPVATARQLEMPLLILQGERDYQVTMREFELWRSGLDGYGDVTFRSYPKLNHLFLEGEGPSVPAEYNQPGRIPDDVYADIADFVDRSSAAVGP
jgi:dienelactone hydrolase